MKNKDPQKEQRNKEIALAVIKEYGMLSGDRGNFEEHWKEIAERVVPSHKNQFQSKGMNQTTGDKRTEFLFDSTASIALNRFSAILDSLLTPRNQTWHRLAANDSNLNKDRDTRLWFEEVTRILFKMRYAPNAGFSTQNQKNYKSLGAYGTGCLLIDEMKNKSGLRYKNIHLSEIYFAENHQGIIDKAYRYFPFTARQARQMWGEDILPESIKGSLKSQAERLFYFIHCVKPREDVEYGRADYRGMDFASYYVSVEGSTLLSEGGYTTFPYAPSRYEQYDGEVYGRSPAMDVLPAIKTLNEQKKTVLKQGQRATDPVLLAHDDGIVDSFSMRPGAINAGGVTADGRPLVHALPIGNIAIGKDLMDDEREVINDAFLVNLFQILVESGQMTATEVMERTREKGILLAPTVGGLQSEYLGRMIEREIDVLSSLRMLPPMPPLLREAQGDYKIEYDSPLSRAQRAEEASGVMRTFETALQVAQATQDPSALDHFNIDVIIPSLSDIQGVPAKWMRSMQEIQQIRSGRAEQQQQQQLIQAAPAGAAMLKAVGSLSKGK